MPKQPCNDFFPKEGNSSVTYCITCGIEKSLHQSNKTNNMLERKVAYDIATNELIPITTISTFIPEIVEKGWGHEKIIYNGESYCGKILSFNEGKKFSLHYHVEKHETWYVIKGKLSLTWIDPTIGKSNVIDLSVGDCVTIPQGVPHQLFAYEDSEVMEVSTPHKDSDSYRIHKGD